MRTDDNRKTCVECIMWTKLDGETPDTVQCSDGSVTSAVGTCFGDPMPGENRACVLFDWLNGGGSNS